MNFFWHCVLVAVILGRPLIALGDDHNKFGDESMPSEVHALARLKSWQRALFYVPRMIGHPSGLVATPGFYLDPQGKYDPDAELQATLKSFNEPPGPLPDEHAQCKFPLRFKIVSRFFEARRIHFPIINCKNYLSWRAALPVSGASLVFSSNYLNNPASMYGHTFLRMHRDRDKSSHDASFSSPLLDYAVNFAANPTTDNFFFYPLFGLTGHFFGSFSLMPYYLKVQEYSNGESRDLWEYPLNLNADEIDSMMQSLWEVGPHGIRYYYFDENCSFILLAIIAAAKPELAAVDQFPNVVSPKDTVTALQYFEGLGTPTRRLSAISRLNARRENLSTYQKWLLLKQKFSKTMLPEISNLSTSTSKENSAKVLDALLEWIAFREKLAGNRQASEYKELWAEALKSRSELKIKSDRANDSIDIWSRPDKGHPAQRFIFGARGGADQNPKALLGFRFTLHDIESPSAGYSRDQEITMGDFYGTLEHTKENKLKILADRGTILRILSVPSIDLLTNSIAWTLTFGADRVYGPDDATWMTYHLEGGPGLAIDIFKNFKLYGIPILNLGLLSESTLKPNAGLGLRSGLLYDVSDTAKVGVTLDYDTVKGNAIFRTWSHNAFLSFDLGTRWEIRAELLHRSYLPTTSALTIFKYF